MVVAGGSLGPVPINPFRRRRGDVDEERRHREREREDARRRAARVQAQVRVFEAAIPGARKPR